MRPRGARGRQICIASLLLLASAGCRDSQRATFPELREAASFRVGAAIVPFDTTFGGDRTFHEAEGLRLLDDSLFVVERGDHRIQVLDREFRRARAIGREGSGPGELRTPYSLAVRGDRIVVSTFGSGISVFHRDGSHRWSAAVTLPTSSIAITDGGRVLAASGKAAHYLLEIDSTGRTRDVAPRPEALRLSQRARLPADQVAVDDRGRWLIFDGSNGVLVIERGEGSATEVMSLPSRLLTELVAKDDQANDRIAADFGGERRQLSRQLARDVALDERGRLFVLAPGTSIAGMLIDVDARAVHPITLPEDKQLAAALLRATHAIVRDGLLYFMEDDQLRVHRLSGGT